MNTSEILPNYVNEQSMSAEIQLEKMPKTAVNYGIEISPEKLNRGTVLSTVRNLVPERYQLVTEKMASEGLNVEQLDDKTLFDRLLGIDELIRMNGHLIAIDVTSGNGTLLYNKRRKFEELKPVFDDLGISHAVVLSVKGLLTDEQVTSFFENLKNLEDDKFTIVLKYRDQPPENN